MDNTLTTALQALKAVHEAQVATGDIFAAQRTAQFIEDTQMCHTHGATLKEMARLAEIEAEEASDKRSKQRPAAAPKPPRVWFTLPTGARITSGKTVIDI